MNRTEKKCLLGSAGLHGLLAVVLLFGSAFFTPKIKHDLPAVIEIIPLNPTKYTDDRSSGGRPDVAPAPAPRPAQPIVQPAPQPQPVQPTPPPPKVEKQPEPVKPKEVAHEKVVKEPEDSKEGDEPVPMKKNGKKNTSTTKTASHIPTNVVKRASVDLKARAERAERDAKAQADHEYAENKRRWQAVEGVFGGAVSKIGRGLSGSVVSVGDYGPGGGGPAVANWRAAVGDLFTRAWNPPQDASDSAKVEARVTIAKNGTVLSGRITKHSGDSALDRSVEKVLREVRSAPPLPDTAKEDQRTVTIIFDLTVKRALG